MKIYYNAQGAEYEALAQAISKLLGQPIRYRKIPYHKHCEIGCYKLYKKGILVCLDESAAKSNQLVSRLRTLGFAPASENNPAEDKGKEVTMSNINYNVTGEQRKTLVHAMSEILGEDAAYQGAPSFAYNIDGYTVSRDGLVTCPDAAAPEEIDPLASALHPGRCRRNRNGNGRTGRCCAGKCRSSYSRRYRAGRPSHDGGDIAAG